MPVYSRALIIAVLAAVILTAGCTSPPEMMTGRSVAPTGVKDTVTPRILAAVPDVRQGTPYSCGAAVLQAVLNYWGKDLREDELVSMLNTTMEGGTSPHSIVSVSRGLNFTAEVRTDLTITDLEGIVNAGIPVIVGLAERHDAPGMPPRPPGPAEGHYMVVIGLDGENVYLEDPAMLGTRGMVPRDEFLTRWQEFSVPDVRNPDALTVRRVAILVRGDMPAAYPAFTRVN